MNEQARERLLAGLPVSWVALTHPSRCLLARVAFNTFLLVFLVRKLHCGYQFALLYPSGLQVFPPSLPCCVAQLLALHCGPSLEF